MRVTFLLLGMSVLPSFATAQSGSDAEKIERALSAGPPSVTAEATVMEWEGRRILREGSNGYVCFPLNAAGMAHPLCVDDTWIRWLEAVVEQKDPPTPTAVAVGCFLQGGPPGSEGELPHIAILVPDTRAFDGMTTDPEQGGPWVMFSGTPYVHLMVPAP